MAVKHISGEIAQDAICALIFPDRGERYLDTIYSDEWVSKHFGDVSSKWESTATEEAWETVTVTY